MILGTTRWPQAREKIAAFRVGDIIGDLRCPTLITHGEDDRHVSVHHAHRVYEALRCPKDLKTFTAREGGSAYCQWDNLHLAHHYMLGWLVEVLGNPERSR